MSKDILLEMVRKRYLVRNRLFNWLKYAKKFETTRIESQFLLYRRLMWFYVRMFRETGAEKKCFCSSEKSRENGSPIATIGFAGKYKADIMNLFVKDGACV